MYSAGAGLALLRLGILLVWTLETLVNLPWQRTGCTFQLLMSSNLLKLLGALFIVLGGDCRGGSERSTSVIMLRSGSASSWQRVLALRAWTRGGGMPQVAP